MGYYLFKLTVTAVLVVAISEIARRSSFWGAIIASIPIVSVLGMIWLYIDTRDVEQISRLSTGIFWLVIPSLSLFLSLPILLRHGFYFYVSLLISISIMIGLYLLTMIILRKFDIYL